MDLDAQTLKPGPHPTWTRVLIVLAVVEAAIAIAGVFR